MYESRVRMWLIFGVWLAVAALCEVIDNFRRSTVALPVFLVFSGIVIAMVMRKHRPRNYKFGLVSPGVARSPFGFEVRASSSRLEYIEGDHKISWQASSTDSTASSFKLSEHEISGWDSPFAGEPMDSKKKQDIAKAVRSAVVYLQLVGAGKIRPKLGRVSSPQ
jgi:hypothetical protein